MINDNYITYKQNIYLREKIININVHFIGYLKIISFANRFVFTAYMKLTTRRASITNDHDITG